MRSTARAGFVLLSLWLVFAIGCSEAKKEEPAEIEAARQEHISQSQREMQDIKSSKP